MGLLTKPPTCCNRSPVFGINLSLRHPLILCLLWWLRIFQLHLIGYLDQLRRVIRSFLLLRTALLTFSVKLVAWLDQLHQVQSEANVLGLPGSGQRQWWQRGCALLIALLLLTSGQGSTQWFELNAFNLQPCSSAQEAIGLRLETSLRALPSPTPFRVSLGPRSTLLEFPASPLSNRNGYSRFGIAGFGGGYSPTCSHGLLEPPRMEMQNAQF